MSDKYIAIFTVRASEAATRGTVSILCVCVSVSAQ